MKRIVIFWVVFFLGILLEQTTLAQIANLRGAANRPMQIAEQYRETSGTPYYLDQYLRGTVFDKKGGSHEVTLKYDTYREEVEILMDGQVLLLDKGLYPKFEIDQIDEESKKLVKLVFYNVDQLPGMKPNKYYREIFSNKKARVLKAKQTYLLRNEDAGYGGTLQPNVFDQKDLYFLEVEGAQIVELNLNHNSILKTLRNESGLKAFLKAKKVRIKKENDLAVLIDFFNEK